MQRIEWGPLALFTISISVCATIAVMWLDDSRDRPQPPQPAPTTSAPSQSSAQDTDGKLYAGILEYYERDKLTGQCADRLHHLNQDRRNGKLRTFRVDVRSGVPFSEEDRKEGVHEDRLVELLKRRELREVLILGGPGIGKTPLALEVVFGQLCSELPSFALELGSLHKKKTFSDLEEGYLFKAIAETWGVVDKSELNEFRLFLQSRDEWLLVLDGLDEVPTPLRKRFIHEVHRLQRRFPSGTLVVVGRPNTYGEQDYGLEIESIVEIPPLNCKDVHHVVIERIEGKENEHLFWDTLALYGLDRKEKGAWGECYYPYLLNYRAISTLVHMFLRARADFSSGSWNYAHLFRMYADERIRRDLDARLDDVDRMLEGHWFMPASGPIPNDLPRFKSRVCENLMQESRCLLESDLFQPVSGEVRRPGVDFEFNEAAMADFFIARVIDKHLGMRSDMNCKSLSSSLEPVMEGRDLMRFLIGMGAVQRRRCVDELLVALTTLVEDEAKAWGVVERGLSREDISRDFFLSAREELEGELKMLKGKRGAKRREATEKALALLKRFEVLGAQ